jgi:hypothetical protein
VCQRERERNRQRKVITIESAKEIKRANIWKKKEETEREKSKKET